jgi:4-diphosphocytidyl-2-C-methyl-D-erythritol kinase
MNENSFTLPSFAKINWFLRVLGKRDDDFHELCTVFQTISFRDYLTFSDADEIVLTCDDDEIPTGEENLIVKAASILKEKFGVRKGAKIHLSKNIPIEGGLGGGSSNAAIALLGLAKLWKIEIGFEELLGIGERLGSDVPFFFYGGTAIGAGRGTEIETIEDAKEKFLLIVTPKVQVSTREAFARIGATRLTKEASKSILQICRFEAKALDLRHSELKNDFEASIFAAEPEIERVKKKLLELGAIKASMSGSGASVFGIFDKQETRQTAEKALSEENWRKFAVATISRSEYREALKKCISLLPISF